VGLLVLGLLVGTAVTRRVGVLDGLDVFGARDGWRLGLPVGRDFVGATEGRDVTGERVGPFVGSSTCRITLSHPLPRLTESPHLPPVVTVPNEVGQHIRFGFPKFVEQVEDLSRFSGSGDTPQQKFFNHNENDVSFSGGELGSQRKDSPGNNATVLHLKMCTLLQQYPSQLS
jgi:hypothetical protein